MKPNLTNLCADCLNAVRWTEETCSDLYSYKRKGICYEKQARCSKTGQIIDLHAVVKCSHHRPRMISKRKITKS